MKRWPFIIIGCVILLLVGGWYFLFRATEPSLETATVRRTTIIQAIDFTGSVTAEQEGSFGFESSGIVATTPVQVGDQVTTDDLLVSLKADDEELSVAKAVADRASSQATALSTLSHAQETFQKTVAENKDTIEKLKQAVRTAKQARDQQAEIWQQAVRDNGSESLAAKQQYALLVDAEGAYTAAQKALSVGIRTADKSTTAARQAVEEASSAYQSTMQTAPGAAGLSSLEATEALARLHLAQQSIHAPFSGVVSEVKAKPGEFVTAGSTVVSLMNPSTFVVEANVPETDIATLQTGMAASITLDAFPDAKAWPATITSIEPFAHIIEGIPTYKVTLSFQEPDSHLRSGFTANVTIHVDQKDNVIAVQRRTLLEKDGKTYVSLLKDDGSIEERVVETGFVGTDGFVEIVSGLREGEQVIIRLPQD